MWPATLHRDQNHMQVVPYQAHTDNQADAFQQQMLHMKEKTCKQTKKLARTPIQSSWTSTNFFISAGCASVRLNESQLQWLRFLVSPCNAFTKAFFSLSVLLINLDTDLCANDTNHCYRASLCTFHPTGSAFPMF